MGRARFHTVCRADVDEALSRGALPWGLGWSWDVADRGLHFWGTDDWHNPGRLRNFRHGKDDRGSHVGPW